MAIFPERQRGLSRLNQHFEAARGLVAARYPGLAGSRLFVTCPQIDKARKGGNLRYFMHVGHFPQTICAHADTEHLPSQNLRGLFLHEFGHLMVGPKGTEADANMAVFEAFGIRILYDKNAVQYIEGVS